MANPRFFRLVDDRESPEAETERPVNEVSLIVRAAMNNDAGHPLNGVPVHWFFLGKIKLTDDAAHFVKCLKGP
jgi:hypothetical protein